MSPLTDSRKKLVDRITKLLAQADSTQYTEEAETARRLAAELMAKHNIAHADVTAEEDYQIVTEDSGRQSKAKHDVALLNVIASINGVAMLTVGNTKYRFVGKQSDIDAFNYMRGLVINQRNAAWRHYYQTRWDKHPGATELNKWKLGFAYGVAALIHSMVKSSEQGHQSWGLVPVDPAKQALDWYKQDHTTRSAQPRASQYSSAGYSAGQNVQLNKGVAQQSGKQLALAH